MYQWRGFHLVLGGSKSIFGLEQNLFLDFGAKAKDEGQGGEMWRGEGRGHRADIGSSRDMPSPGRDSFPPAFSLPRGRKLVAETPQKSSLEVTEVIMSFRSFVFQMRLNVIKTCMAHW